ncbi:MAG TPA: hypothetical protein VGG69_07070 [Rhizomicrobium sp.]|jgi:hypothetical protein
MRRYYFNFRKGDEISPDRLGMWLPDLGAARDEAIQVWGDLIAVALLSGESPMDCEYEIADESGEILLTVPLGEPSRLN